MFLKRPSEQLEAPILTDWMRKEAFMDIINLKEKEVFKKEIGGLPT